MVGDNQNKRQRGQMTNDAVRTRLDDLTFVLGSTLARMQGEGLMTECVYGGQSKKQYTAADNYRRCSGKF
jgi:hypothetical protein